MCIRDRLIRYQQYRTGNHLDLNDPAMAQLVPSALEDLKINDCIKDLKDFQSIMVSTQKKEITLTKTRALFDGVIKEHTFMGTFFSMEARIVHLNCLSLQLKRFKLVARMH